MNNRLAHGSISSTTSSNVGNNEIVANQSNNTNTSNISHFQLPAGEPLLTPAITDPIAVPVPPPPSPEVPGYLQKSAKEASSLLVRLNKNSIIIIYVYVKSINHVAIKLFQ